MEKVTRTEAGEEKCDECGGFGETCLAGRSAHRSNWVKCEKCNGAGATKAATDEDEVI